MTQVVVSSEKNLRQQIWTDHHEFAAGEPKSVGGDDSAPSPYELLLGALGACTSMTLEIYARRNDWPLEGVEVVLEHDRVHARDCEECAAEAREAAGDGYLDVIRKRISLRGPLTAEQVARLAAIAERCPVNRALRQSVHTSQTVHLAPAPPVPPEALR